MHTSVKSGECAILFGKLTGMEAAALHEDFQGEPRVGKIRRILGFGAELDLDYLFLFQYTTCCTDFSSLFAYREWVSIVPHFVERNCRNAS